MYMMTPFQIVFQNHITHPEWLWQDHAIVLTRCGWPVCDRYGVINCMQVRMWLRECRALRRR